MEKFYIFRDEAIFNTHPEVVSLNAGIEARDKKGNLVNIDEEKVSSEIIKLGKKWESQSYYRNRASQYPPITDQLDDLFHQGVFSEEMTEKIQKLK